ncbi:MAG: hypothetical protein K2P92_08760 [Bdellovibrionaceae bacterium]|nr:hypothetical protein [Pseudobdellovibrionaceae bacterium]
MKRIILDELSCFESAKVAVAARENFVLLTTSSYPHTDALYRSLKALKEDRRLAFTDIIRIGSALAAIGIGNEDSAYQWAFKQKDDCVFVTFTISSC